ncbi:winged helix-turn-helix domain-containing protein [Amycolatopsis sp. QT-25]|uniref:ArsR/SmtB family transcription factor n=1 Tax=Amycolatopsis sp. QT-25 TaxID=3034022 RepID=UPI00320AD536
MSAVALAGVAALLADGTRAAFCAALLDGRAWTARELADVAGVAPSTTSEHLTQLVAGGLLVERRQGRHRYVQLASPEIAQLSEDLAAHAPPGPAPVGLRAVSVSEALAKGRTCYDHLAGRLGVAIADALIDRGLLTDSYGFALTESGLAWFRDRLAFSPQLSRRPLARGLSGLDRTTFAPCRPGRRAPLRTRRAGGLDPRREGSAADPSRPPRPPRAPRPRPVRTRSLRRPGDQMQGERTKHATRSRL